MINGTISELKLLLNKNKRINIKNDFADDVNILLNTCFKCKSLKNVININWDEGCVQICNASFKCFLNKNYSIYVSETTNNSVNKLRSNNKLK